MLVDSDIPENNKNLLMIRVLFFLAACTISLLSCRSTKVIQTAIAKKDTVVVAPIIPDTGKADSLRFSNEVYQKLKSQHIAYKTFSAKLNIDYTDASEKKYNVNANLRMYKDSIIWISVNAVLGIEALRVYITKTSVKIMDKQNRTISEKSISSLQELASIPFDLTTLQNLLIGNPIFLTEQIISYSLSPGSISLLMNGDWFKNLITLNETDGALQRSKLDDIDLVRNRTCDLSYADYDTKKGVNFPAKRRIYIAEKTKLDIKLEFKQYEFNEELTYPFSIPRNYKAL